MEKQSEEHVSQSPPLSSPSDSPLHSKHNSEGHISLSLSPVGSDHIDFHRSPGNDDRLRSPENRPAPPLVVSRNVFKVPVDNRIVLADPLAAVERAVLEEPKAKADSGPAAAESDGGWRRRYTPSILSGGKREVTVNRAALGFRVFGFVFCLVSFSVMTADRNQGWALDSYDRYREFRYCMYVNVIGFVYSAAQAFDLSYNLATGKYIVRHQLRLRHYLDFTVDQIIAYLLISASSSAAIRVDDWQSNWGNDKFPDMATASISMSFLAFVALAISSLISGYALCTSKLR